MMVRNPAARPHSKARFLGNGLTFLGNGASSVLCSSRCNGQFVLGYLVSDSCCF